MSQITWPRDRFVAKGVYFIRSHQSEVTFPRVVAGRCAPWFEVSYCNTFWSHCINQKMLLPWVRRIARGSSSKWHPKCCIRKWWVYAQRSNKRFTDITLLGCLGHYPYIWAVRRANHRQWENTLQWRMMMPWIKRLPNNDSVWVSRRHYPWYTTGSEEGNHPKEKILQCSTPVSEEEWWSALLMTNHQQWFHVDI